jgi:hypothetical protein
MRPLFIGCASNRSDKPTAFNFLLDANISGRNLERDIL